MKCKKGSLLISYLLLGCYVCFQPQFMLGNISIKTLALGWILVIYCSFNLLEFKKNGWNKKQLVLSIITYVFFITNMVFIKIIPTDLVTIDAILSILWCVLLILHTCVQSHIAIDNIIFFMLNGFWAILFIGIKLLYIPDLMSLFGGLLSQNDKMIAYLLLYASVSTFMFCYYENKFFSCICFILTLFSYGLLIVAWDWKSVVLLVIEYILILCFFKRTSILCSKVFCLSAILLLGTSELGNLLRWTGFECNGPPYMATLIVEAILAIEVCVYIFFHEALAGKKEVLYKPNIVLIIICALQILIMPQSIFTFPLLVLIAFMKPLPDECPDIRKVVFPLYAGISVFIIIYIFLQLIDVQMSDKMFMISTTTIFVVYTLMLFIIMKRKMVFGLEETK